MAVPPQPPERVKFMREARKNGLTYLEIAAAYKHVYGIEIVGKTAERYTSDISRYAKQVPFTERSIEMDDLRPVLALLNLGAPRRANPLDVLTYDIVPAINRLKAQAGRGR